MKTSLAILAGSLLLSASALAELTTISKIQGPSHYSPLVDQTVSVRGVVTQKYDAGGFWIQDQQGDGKDETSDGLLVFVPKSDKMAAAAAKVPVGSLVEVTAVVKEYVGAKFPGDLFTTELDTVVNITIVQDKGPEIKPTVIGPSGRMPPQRTIFAKFDDGPNQTQEVTSQAFFKTYPLADVKNRGLDFLESLEGTLVTVKNPRVTGQPYSNSFWVLPEQGLGSTGLNAAGGITMSADADGNDNNPERILVGAAAGVTHPTDLAVGDTVGDITGVLHYDKGSYKIMATQPATLIKQNTNVFPLATPTPKDEFTFGTYNMENLAATAAPEKFAKIAKQIVEYLGSPAIFVANEIQDNNGAAKTGDQTSDSTLTVNTLIDAIKTAGGPTYKATWINPVAEADGGEPLGNIRSVIFYNEAAGVKMTPAARAGSATESQTILKDEAGKPTLGLNPGRLDPSNEAWQATRKTLSASFEIDGERYFVLANHFSSKGGSDNPYGAIQPPAQGALARRIGQAKINYAFAQSLLEADPQAKIVVVGDLNDFAWSTPLQILTGNAPGNAAGNPKLFDLAETLLPEPERYSYNFNGQNQALDHIVVSEALKKDTTSYTPIHVNTWGKFADRTSDHDPEVFRARRSSGTAPSSSSSSLPAGPTSTPASSSVAGPTSSTNAPSSTAGPASSTHAPSSTDVPSSTAGPSATNTVMSSTTSNAHSATATEASTSAAPSETETATESSSASHSATTPVETATSTPCTEVETAGSTATETHAPTATATSTETEKPAHTESTPCTDAKTAAPAPTETPAETEKPAPTESAPCTDAETAAPAPTESPAETEAPAHTDSAPCTDAETAAPKPTESSAETEAPEATETPCTDAETAAPAPTETEAPEATETAPCTDAETAAPEATESAPCTDDEATASSTAAPAESTETPEHDGGDHKPVYSSALRTVAPLAGAAALAVFSFFAI
ncbi:hypothetical protein HDU90_005548 [Geranomyces variabilis]|nr:hypothetical protein HDU90_005548 [Geranomyces variabilis]